MALMQLYPVVIAISRESTFAYNKDHLTQKSTQKTLLSISINREKQSEKQSKVNSLFENCETQEPAVKNIMQVREI